jgi:hypothetical protein
LGERVQGFEDSRGQVMNPSIIANSFGDDS